MGEVVEVTPDEETHEAFGATADISKNDLARTDTDVDAEFSSIQMYLGKLQETKRVCLAPVMELGLFEFNHVLRPTSVAFINFKAEMAFIAQSIRQIKSRQAAEYGLSDTAIFPQRRTFLKMLEEVHSGDMDPVKVGYVLRAAVYVPSIEYKVSEWFQKVIRSSFPLTSQMCLGGTENMFFLRFKVPDKYYGVETQGIQTVVHLVHIKDLMVVLRSLHLAADLYGRRHRRTWKTPVPGGLFTFLQLRACADMNGNTEVDINNILMKYAKKKKPLISRM